MLRKYISVLKNRRKEGKKEEKRELDGERKEEMKRRDKRERKTIENVKQMTLHWFNPKGVTSCHCSSVLRVTKNTVKH